jgi:hypothetical protein
LYILKVEHRVHQIPNRFQQFNNSQLEYLLKKPDAMKEKDPSTTPPSESFQLSFPPLHHIMIPKMKSRRRAPLFNYP